MDKDTAKVLNHFENISAAFDNIYKDGQDSLLHKLIDALFRKNILERRRKLMLSLSGGARNKNILDIGCGSGRYAVVMAKDKPNFVLGLDISPLMINLAKNLAEANKVADICKFENCDFLLKDFDDKFDIIIAAGVFDYTAHPEVFLLKIRRLLQGRAILSFPVKWTIMTPLRMAWLLKKGCPNYYYSKKEIKKLFEESGLKINSVHKIGSFLVPGNYIVVCGH